MPAPGAVAAAGAALPGASPVTCSNRFFNPNSTATAALMSALSALSPFNFRTTKPCAATAFSSAGPSMPAPGSGAAGAAAAAAAFFRAVSASISSLSILANRMSPILTSLPGFKLSNSVDNDLMAVFAVPSFSKRAAPVFGMNGSIKCAQT